MSREPVEAALRRLHEEKGEDIIATKIKAGRRLCRNGLGVHVFYRTWGGTKQSSRANARHCVNPAPDEIYR